MLRYRLGLDLGTNSIGWCIIALNEDCKPDSILRAGVRIFPDGRDPQSKTSLAVHRREKRGARRRRDRYLLRRDEIMRRLIELGLMPEDSIERKSLEKLNPYELRFKALYEPLSDFELGRVLFHLNQRRGFKSNRKSSKKEESKNLGPLITELRKNIEAECQTLGEYLWKQLEEGKNTRAREGHPLYPDRRMYEDEFCAIQEAQAQHHSKLSPEDWEGLCNLIYRQRP
jgi:CRISPR-associated endonuclease Csn1